MVKFIKKNAIILSILFFFSSVSLVFISGKFSSQTEVEGLSHYASLVAKNNTKSGNIFSVAVTRNDTSGALPNSADEFNNLYGSFKEREITFASIINSNKDKNLTIVEDGVTVSNCLSMFYFGPTGTIQYDGAYKHYIYPIQLMFPDNKSSYGVSRYIFNISQSHADKILSLRGEQCGSDGKYSSSQYQSLLQTKTIVKNGDLTSEFCINNIFLEKNYYYNGLNEVIGDFVMVSYYLPWNLRSDDTNCYFFNTDAFQDDYFMKYINNRYGLQKYDISVLEHNIVGNVNIEYLLSFNSRIISELDWLSVLLICLSFVLSILGIITYCLFTKTRLFSDSLILLSILIPYLCFYIVYIATNSISYFSFISCKISVFLMLAIYLVILIIKFFKTKVIENKKRCANEINV